MPLLNFPMHHLVHRLGLMHHLFFDKSGLYMNDVGYKAQTRQPKVYLLTNG